MEDEIMLEDMYNEFFDKKTAIYTITPGLDEKLDLITVATIGTFSLVNSINSLLMSNTKNTPTYVNVTNMPELPSKTELMPKSSVGITSIDEGYIKKLAVAIGDQILGTARKENAANAGVATLSDIAYILTHGTISTIDLGTREELKSINKNLY